MEAEDITALILPMGWLISRGLVPVHVMTANAHLEMSGT